MRFYGSFSKVIACGVLMGAMFAISTVEAAVGRAVVRKVTGTADFADQGGQWKPLRVNRVLGPTSSVRTGESSVVDLFLGENGPTVRLLANTTLALDKLNIDRAGIDVVIETFLDLKTGTIQGNVKPMTVASKYEVKTPRTVCAIRGTEYQISADGVHHVITGAVVVAYTRPTGEVLTSTVNAGQTFVPPADPTAPTATPTVRPTQPTDNVQPPIPPDFPPLVPEAPPVQVVPEPVEFVSPGTGRSTGG